MKTFLDRLLGCIPALLVSLAIIFTAEPASAVETITYYHNDIAGSPILATDAAGAVLWKENYRPYGDKLNNPPAGADNKLGFTGKPYDANTGLSYLGARYYDPVIGRFTGIDPLDYDEKNLHSFNRYTYANNNPYMFVDPDGKEGVSTLWMSDHAPAVVAGKAFGALLAYGVGVASGDQMLQSTAIAGMLENRQANVDAVLILGTAGRSSSAVGVAAEKGAAAAARETGSYTNLHASGKTYDGKGSRERSQESARRIERETGDKHIATDWTPAQSIRDAFKQESKRLDANGGPKSDGNYNKIESPGKKMRTQDGS